MINALRGLLARILGVSRDEFDVLSVPRSPAWRALRNRHLREHPECAVCGSRNDVVPHHVVPFHVDPSRELDPTNLLTLCEGRTFNCHLFFGHLRRWDRYNASVVEDAATWRRKVNETEEPRPPA